MFFFYFYSSQHFSRTGKLYSNLISHQYKLNLLAKSMQNKFENSKMKQSEIAYQLGYSSSTLQTYRNDKNMVSPYRIQTNNTNKRSKRVSNTNFNNNQHSKRDLKDPK